MTVCRRSPSQHQALPPTLLIVLGTWCIALASSPLPADDQVVAAVSSEVVGEVAAVVPASANNPIRESKADEASPASAPVEEVSDAERIGHLQRTIQKDKSQLEQLHQELKSAEEEFDLAGKIFNKVDDRYHETKDQLSAARESGDQAKVAELEAQVEDQKSKRALCKERFDLSIQTKKSLQQQIGVLKEKITQDTAALAKLAEIESPSEPVDEAPAPSERPSPLRPVAAPPETPRAPQPESKPEPKAEQTSEKTAPALLPGGAIAAGMQAPSSDVEAESADVRQAKDEASRTAAAATEARQAVEAIDKRQESLDKNIELEQKLRDAARKQADNAVRVAQEFHDDYRKLSESNAPPEELSKIGQRIQSSELRVEKSRDEFKRRSERLDDLQSQRHALMAERIAALEQAEAQALAADKAKRRVDALENPFSQRNILKWSMRHGPNIFIIVVGFLVLRGMVKVVCRRVVVLMTHKGTGTRKERENRAQTIVGVFHNAATVVGYGGGTLMILEECGVPVGPLLGGAAVFGLAVAFGSQNLIRDYFYGFVILLENQYGVNDIVKIGEITGQVERITLRMTVIRDSDGVNFIPNGQIASVKNLTHGWSQAVFDIAVDFREDVDRVMDVLLELGRELRRDSSFADKILDDPAMQGVDVLGDSTVTIKMSIKTRPFEQWSVKREMLRRVKKRFEERGILLPAGQRTIVHRYTRPDDEQRSIATDDSRWDHRRSA